ncbi:hypothetical protein CWS43_21125 [Rahnella sp. AA]|uniref:hypothetical protein n=1 Tax=Rahnella sp. AA TaxID=2057180 RepID=UPI000C332E4B|nr:hypothetical protein [Rahnella sp. AA]PKE28536.1 hypothetical protein CWS43_21125 [Rahnella sp. AA]
MLSLKFFRFLIISVVLSSTQLMASTEKPVKGRFVITQKGETLNDGSRESITWLFNIDGNGGGALKNSSWHAFFTCDGVYKITQDSGQLEFMWDRNANPKKVCYTPSPQFIMKKENGHWLIKSKLFPWGDGGWEQIEKITEN